MQSHANRASFNRTRNILVALATVFAASTVVPAEAAAVVSNSLQQSSLVSVIEHIVGIIAVVFFVIVGIINNTLVKRLGFKSSEFVGLPNL
ncbi:hypothetical protein [Corynebacterium sp. HS2168-gen11]|uniref:hypothetical protein n=1 Tax=Corynebacterium sp. HS2168-gen11 TaxID=2974027 RepID=UPI00216AC19F|nr:hypothetical protein [Corynebacterium sp. HS2168-gen11]MCS4536475.1 hypothetical protein [Corynebacterium sp. HS2168-gen11]